MTLQQALQSEDFDTAKTLLINGKTLPDDIKEYQRTSIFDKIIREKAFEIVDLFIENGTIETDIYEYDSFNRSFFDSMVKNLPNDADSISFLEAFLPKIESLNDELEGQSLLSMAIEKEMDIELIKALVTGGCDLNIINRSEENLIHQIVKKYVRAYDKGLLYLQFFYEEGLDIDKPNIARKTPLHLAVESHKNEYIKWLMENGADANAQDKDGNSPFFLATSQGGGADKYEIMRAYGTPQFDQLNSSGESLLYEAVRMMSGNNDGDSKLLQLILEDGADLYQTSTNRQQEVTTIDVLAEKPAELLQVVIDSGQLDMNRQDNLGNTLLHKVCNRYTLHEEKRAKEIYRMVKLLLKSGADPSITNNEEKTPMMLAADDNLKTKTVELLLSHQ